MKLFKVIVGYIDVFETPEEMELNINAKRFPMNPFNIIADSESIAKYLVNQQEITEYWLEEAKEPPYFPAHKLN